MARVTIVTPTYQHARFIDACLRSVLDQTERDWEMIIVDDGSTDGTADLADMVADSRIRVIRRRHEGFGGLGAAYNAALAESGAPIVAVLEGDDTWPADKLERQLPAFDDPGVVLAYGRAELIDGQGRAFADYGWRPRGNVALNDPLGAVLPILARGNFIVAPTVMVRRSALDRIGGFWQPPSMPFVDHPTWLRLALEGRFAFSNAVVGRWRRHARQYSTSAVDEPPIRSLDYVDEVGTLAAERGLGDAPRAARPSAATIRARALISAARLALIAREWGAARQAFLEVVRTAPTGPRVAIAAVGVASSVAHRDIEWLFRAAGRLSWPASLYTDVG